MFLLYMKTTMVICGLEPEEVYIYSINQINLLNGTHMGVKEFFKEMSVFVNNIYCVFFYMDSNNFFLVSMRWSFQPGNNIDCASSNVYDLWV